MSNRGTVANTVGWRRLVAWVASGVAQPVPVALRACEFECRETECSAERWSGCPHRWAGRSGLAARTRFARQESGDGSALGGSEAQDLRNKSQSRA